MTTVRYTFALTWTPFLPLPIVELALEVTEPDEEPAPKETEQ